MSDLTILYLNAVGEISGAERSLLAMLDAGTGWRTATAAPEGPLLRAVRARGEQAVPVALETVRRPDSPATAWRMLRALRAGWREVARAIAAVRPTIVHANTTAAMLYAVRTEAPVIWQVRDLTPLGRLGNILYRRAARVAVISPTVREDVLQYAHDGGAKIVLLPPAVDTALFTPAADKPALRRRLGLPDDVPLLGLIAQFVPWKRHHLFLDALELLADRRWHAVLAGADLHGDAAYRAELRARTDRAPLTGRVTWLPWQEDAAPLVAALDLCVLTSQREPFGRVLIEAMACAVPVVAVDEGGPHDIIAHGVTGLLTPAHAPELAAAIGQLLEDPHRWEEMGRNGTEMVNREYNLSAQRNRLDSLYRDL